MKKIIKIEQRTHDVMAYIYNPQNPNDKSKWDCGPSNLQAIGNLIVTNCGEFNIEIKFEG
jgi:hypothetical protein